VIFDRRRACRCAAKAGGDVPRDEPGCEPGKMVGTNWRSRPLRGARSFRVASCRHMSPASSERVVSLRVTTRKPGGERQRPAMRSTSGAGPGNQLRNRVTPVDSGFGSVGEHSRSTTECCYCEPVWWSVIRRFGTNESCRRGVPVSQPGCEKGDGPSRIEFFFGKAPTSRR
jgi:hypothetical protein